MLKEQLALRAIHMACRCQELWALRAEPQIKSLCKLQNKSVQSWHMNGTFQRAKWIATHWQKGSWPLPLRQPPRACGSHTPYQNCGKAAQLWHLPKLVQPLTSSLPYILRVQNKTLSLLFQIHIRCWNYSSISSGKLEDNFILAVENSQDRPMR